MIKTNHLNQEIYNPSNLIMLHQFIPKKNCIKIYNSIITHYKKVMF